MNSNKSRLCPRDFSGSLVVKIASSVRGASSIPGQGTKMPHPMWYGQKVFTFKAGCALQSATSKSKVSQKP